MGLKEYRSKRDFGKTPEPEPVRRSGEGYPVFVIHKHAARTLHYDLRLEMKGVLKSWAVPKGPSRDPSVKRLAIMVEDHPLDYKDFEGVIPEGSYGAGSVIIWDRGVYYHPSAKNRKENEEFLLNGMRKGDIKFVLAGEKLQGEFALVKTRMDEKSWLLIKKNDRYAIRDDILKDGRSVVSGKSVEELYHDQPENRRNKKRNWVTLQEVMEGDAIEEAPVRPMPHGIKPMLATLIDKPFDHKDWIFEVKWDGYRAVAEVQNGNVLLYTRNGISLNQKFRAIAASLQRFGFEALLDGEVVVVDDQGYPDFQMLQNYTKSGTGNLVYYVFDILHLERHDLKALPLIKRKEILRKILPVSPRIKLSDHVWKDGVLFFYAAREKGLEGIIAKHSQSIYRVGMRSRHWFKIKARLTQDCVIVGFTEARGGRKYFGSLVLGAFHGKRLVYIGHSGGGFGAEDLREIREKLDPLIRKKCPFQEEPGTNARATWLKPELVCEVAFAGWTKDGLMRQPVFLRLRGDKSPREAVREMP